MTASGWALQVKDMRTGDRARKGASRAVWYERHESALFLDQHDAMCYQWPAQPSVAIPPQAPEKSGTNVQELHPSLGAQRQRVARVKSPASSL